VDSLKIIFLDRNGLQQFTLLFWLSRETGIYSNLWSVFSWIKPTDALNSSFIGVTTLHVSGSLRSILLPVANGHHNCIKCAKADVRLRTPDDGQKDSFNRWYQFKQNCLLCAKDNYCKLHHLNSVYTHTHTHTHTHEYILYILYTFHYYCAIYANIMRDGQKRCPKHVES